MNLSYSVAQRPRIEPGCKGHKPSPAHTSPENKKWPQQVDRIDEEHAATKAVVNHKTN